MDDVRVFRTRVWPTLVFWVGITIPTFLVHALWEAWPHSWTMLFRILLLGFGFVGLFVVIRVPFKKYREVRIGHDWILGPTEEILGPRRIAAKDIVEIAIDPEGKSLVVAAREGLKIIVSLPEYGAAADELVLMAQALRPELTTSTASAATRP